MSTPRKKRTAKEIFNAAVEYYEPRQWEGYIVDACGEDEALRQRVRGLLEAHRQSDSFLDGNAERTEESVISERPGTLIGPYKLLQEIGEGGFGVVYMAEQLEPVRRKVALKIIKPGMDTKQVIARFEAERQALAMMDHPNIAKVLDAGATESGRPYFVMELVKGVPITEFCDSNKLVARDRLELFVAVCRAVQHAHQKGLIHRDLKPTNVMVTLHDNKPMPVIIDFGVSKAISQQLTEKTLFTAYGQMVGTPAYMSPEQAQMSRMDIDMRSDIYSLGVLLYELLTGSPPLDAERLRGTAYAELQRLISEEEAPKPSMRLSTLGKALAEIAQRRGTDPKRLGQFLRGDLDWIVMKALEKERKRRYDTANGLANDVERFLNDEAVEACPPSATYRLRKYVRRNRSLVFASSLVAASLLIGLVVSIAGFVQAARQRDVAKVAEQRAVAARDEAKRERDAAQREKEHAANAEKAAKQRSEEAEAVVSLLGEMIGSANPDSLKGSNYTVRQLLDDFSMKFEERLTDQPAVEATVRLMISDVYYRLYVHDKGLLHAERSYEIRRELFGDTHELTIRAERAKGLHLLFGGGSGRRASEGAQILQKIVELHPPFMDVDHEFTLRTKNGASLLLGGNEALEIYRELLDEALSKLGNDNAVTTMIRSNYANDLLAAGRLDEAELQARKAIEGQEAVGGVDDLMASFFRSNYARILDKNGDYEGAKRLLLHVLPFQQKHLGAAHRYSHVTLARLVSILHDHNESAVAEDLLVKHIESIRSDVGADSLQSVLSLVRGTPPFTKTRDKEALLRAAAEIFLEGHHQNDEANTTTVQQVAVELLTTLNRFRSRDDFSEMAEKVARAAWDAAGSDNATVELARGLVNAMRAAGNMQGVVQFLQHDLQSDSALFREYDVDSNGQLSGREVVGLFSPVSFIAMDQDSDGRVTQNETDESLWTVIIELDENVDGSIDRTEIMTAFRAATFARLDGNGDGQLVDDEVVSTARRFDTDGDGKVSKEEYVDDFVATVGNRFFGRSSRSLTPDEAFTQNDQDADDQVSMDEADKQFWNSITEFDVNKDDAVDRVEYEQGLHQRNMEKAERFFAMMDRNSDGQASQDEVPIRLWDRWRSFDANGDETLNKDEFMQSQTASGEPNDER